MRLIDIILVKSDPIRNQSSIRAMQIIKSLRKKYSIIGLGWNRGSTTYEFANDEGSLQLFNLNAPYGYERYGTLRLAAYFPIFWMWVFIKLCVHRPKSIHACDLATILPCYIYKVLFRRKLIFDVLDRYGMTYVPKDRNVFFKTLHSLVNSLEEIFAKNSDVLIAVSDKIFLTFRKKPRNCVTIMNCPEDHLINKSRLKTNGFNLLFTGAIRPGRGLETISDIVMNMKDTELIVTGVTKDRKLQNKIARIPHIKYYGFLDRNKLLDLEASTDVMIALYDLNLQNQYEYGMANKVLEAMMCGLPIITNISHDIVNDTKCGLIVEYGNVQQIKKAIITLRDNPELRRLLGKNGRKAYVEKYNWTKMEEKLLKTYDVLLNDHINVDKR
jgi:glycosyltransferase involved in cell wall biosynthesis